MKSLLSKAHITIFAMVALCITAFSFTSKMGLDSFEIYLNTKLILKQSVNQPLSLRVLQLDKASANDELRIIYKHCTHPGGGTGRNITVKDEKGTVLKKWIFANVDGGDLSMVIPVKELLQLEKNNAQHDLCLHYSSKELSKSEPIAFLHAK